MARLDIAPIRDTLPIGVRVNGVTQQALEDPAVRAEINAAFEKYGLLLFEDIEPTGAMHVALSEVFGPLKEHPVTAVPRVERDTMPGVIDTRYLPGSAGEVEIDGVRKSSWLPWHFDHCYNDELNRGGVLRAIDIPPDGPRTGFVDGVALYEALPRHLRDRVEDKEILYILDVQYASMRFGRPAGLVEIRRKPVTAEFEQNARSMPRAIHPAVWRRPTGEKVLHISPWMAQGIAGQENAEGDQLLEEVCQAINALADEQSYFHSWKTSEMLIWDNWRFLHAVSGMNPSHSRRMQRTTIKGDYGLGHFENGRTGGSVLETMV